jgi:radical SAM superfamily enzyme YgiQ (UPF0313 family)
MKKNILLVYPKFPDSNYWSFSHALPFVDKKSAMPPLGLITVAASLPKDYKVKLVDLNIEDLTDEAIKWSDALFTSTMIVQKKSLDDIISRATRFGKPIVAGGPHPTLYYDEIKGVNHFIIGEAETGILEAFISDFEKNSAKQAYARPAIRNAGQGKTIDEKEYKRLIDFFGTNADIQLGTRPLMTDSPMPRFDLLKIEAYNSMALQFSRGCPRKCEFCNEGVLYGNEPRIKSDEQFMKEVKAIYDLGHRGSVFIVDDNFIANRRVRTVLPKLTKFQKKYDYPFHILTEADISLSENDELMDGMRDAGFTMVFIGYESTDLKVLEKMGKIQNIKVDLYDATKKIQRKGMEVAAGFIVGNDNDPPDICDKIFEFRQKAGIPTAMVGMLTALRGSPLYERLLKEGRLLKESDGQNTHLFEPNFKPLEGNDIDKLVADYKLLLLNLYGKNLKNYYDSSRVLFKNLGNRPKASRDITKTEVKAFLKINYKQIFSRQFYQHSKFLSISFLNHFKHFPEAVTFGVKGYHYKKITKYALKADKLQYKLHDKMEYFKTRFGETLQEKITHSKESFSKLVNEKDKYLIKMKKKINRLPVDYRGGLQKKFENVANYLNSISIKNRPLGS